LICLPAGGVGRAKWRVPLTTRGEFILSLSSIKILDKGNEAGFHVLLVEKGDGRNVACDGCREVDVPLCMQDYKENDALEKILREFLEKTKPREGTNKGLIGTLMI
jgi:hypothetical protein